jgi:hypothetical protein
MGGWALVVTVGLSSYKWVQGEVKAPATAHGITESGMERVSGAHLPVC